MKIFIIPIILVLLVPLIPNSDATINLENMSFLSDDGNVVIDFGKNIIEQKTSKIKITPTLDLGIVQTTNHDFLLDFSDDVFVKVYGNSFVIKSLEEPSLFIYARNVGDNNYVVKVYTVDNGFQKQTFTGTLEPTPENLNEFLEPEPSETLPEMNLLVKHTERLYWKESYLITVRVFDAELNRFNEFDQNWGYITGIDILVEIFNGQDELLTSLSGQTGKTGYYEAQSFVPDKLNPRGVYTVNVTADNGQVELIKTLPLHILGQRSSGSSGP